MACPKNDDVAEQTSGKTSASWMKSQAYAADSSFVVTKYEEELTKKQEKLDKIMRIWYALPTSESEETTEE